MKILLCGATGFIGSNILRKLSLDKNYEIKAIGYTRKIDEEITCDKVYGDLRDPYFVKEIIKGTDVILQFAATTSGSKDIVNSPSLHVTDNAVMNSYLLKYASEIGVKKFIFPSCTVMYQSSYQPQKENDFNPSDELFHNYFGVGNTKLYIEKMCQFFSSVSDMSATVLRHSNIYGPYDKFDLEKSHFVGATVRKILNASENEDIIVWGDGKTARDLIYVKDMVDAVNKSLSIKSKFGIYNVGYGRAFEVNEIVEKLVKISNKKLNIVHDLSKPSISTRLAIDSNLFNKTCGWQVETNIDIGLQLTYEWARKNI